MIYHTDWFADLKDTASLYKSHLIMVYDPFNVLLDLVCSCFVENFYVMFISDIDL